MLATGLPVDKTLGILTMGLIISTIVAYLFLEIFERANINRKTIPNIKVVNCERIGLRDSIYARIFFRGKVRTWQRELIRYMLLSEEGKNKDTEYIREQKFIFVAKSAEEKKSIPVVLGA